MRSSDAWRERIRPPIGPRHRWTMNRTRNPKAIVVAVANQKGGVAKTTTVASLGAAWSQLGQRVLIVDLDPASMPDLPWLRPRVDRLLGASGVSGRGGCLRRCDRDGGGIRLASGHHRLGDGRAVAAYPNWSRGPLKPGAGGRTVLERIGDDYGVAVLSPPIPKSIRFAETPAVGRTVLSTVNEGCTGIPRSCRLAAFSAAYLLAGRSPDRCSFIGSRTLRELGIELIKLNGRLPEPIQCVQLASDPFRSPLASQ